MNLVRNYYHEDKDILSVNVVGMSPNFKGQIIGIHRVEHGEIKKDRYRVVDLETNFIIGEINEYITVENVYLEKL